MTPDQELLFLDSFFGGEAWEFEAVTGEQRRADRAAEYVPVVGPVVLTRDAALEDVSVTDAVVAKMLGLHLAWRWSTWTGGQAFRASVIRPILAKFSEYSIALSVGCRNV